MSKGLVVRLLFVVLLGVCSSVAADEPNNITRDKSPDGKFALRITKEDQGWSAAIIDLKSKGDVVALEIYQNYIEEAHLVWSKDSQRVAYFEPDRRGGGTTVYFRSGDKFDPAELPELPECKIPAPKGAEYVKTIEATTKAQKWLTPDTLLLRVHSDDLMEKGDKQYSNTCTQIVTVAFDSNQKASVKSAKRVRSD